MTLFNFHFVLFLWQQVDKTAQINGAIIIFRRSLLNGQNRRKQTLTHLILCVRPERRRNKFIYAVLHKCPFVH